jgi:hypothetical protein
MFQATSVHHQEGTIESTPPLVKHTGKVTVRRAGQHAGQSPCQCVLPEDVLIQLFPPEDERLSLETCRGGKINTLKK